MGVTRRLTLARLSSMTMTFVERFPDPVFCGEPADDLGKTLEGACGADEQGRQLFLHPNIESLARSPVCRDIPEITY